MRRILLTLILGLAVLAGAATTVFARGGHGGGGHGGGFGGHGGGFGGRMGGFGGHGGHPSYHGGHGGRPSYHGGHGRQGGYGRHGGHGHGGHGHGFRHRHYHNWSRGCWFPAYGCYGYYCPDDGQWYYWYGPDNCYLPVDDMAAYPPDDSVNAPPTLPPGATSLP